MSADADLTAEPVDVATFGETLGLLTGDTVGPLRFSRALHLGFGGAESNLAIGIRRLGRPVAWMGRVGDDEFGRLILAGLRGERVDVSAATVDQQVPTALMIKERRTTSHRRVTYYRRDCAGSRLRAADLDLATIRKAEILAVSAITPGLSASAREAVDTAIEAAREAGTVVCVDLNYRSVLWAREEAAPAMADLARRTDVVLASEAEATMATGERQPEAAAHALCDLGAGQAVVKLGADGAVAVIDGDPHRVEAVPVEVVDPVGAGDAFAAGYLTALLDGLPVADRLHRAALSGAFAVTVAGDWEGLPTLDSLGLLDDTDPVQR